MHANSSTFLIAAGARLASFIGNQMYEGGGGGAHQAPSYHESLMTQLPSHDLYLLKGSFVMDKTEDEEKRER